MTTILRFILLFLLAPALAITTQAAGVDQGDFRVNDKGFRVASGLLMVNSAIYAAHGEYIEAGFSALGSVGMGWVAARTATGSVAGLSSAYTTPKWHQGSVSASESVATSLSSSRFSGGAANTGGPVLREGSFSVIDWTGYPAHLPKPTGPMFLLNGPEYSAARNAANVTNNGLREGFGLRGLRMVYMKFSL